MECHGAPRSPKGPIIPGFYRIFRKGQGRTKEKNIRVSGNYRRSIQQSLCMSALSIPEAGGETEGLSWIGSEGKGRSGPGSE